MSTLADWGPISTDSAQPGYTGLGLDTIVDQADPSKFFTSAYYADQIVKFQSAMNQLDDTYFTFTQLLPTLDPVADAASITAIQQWLSDYADKKTEIQAVAATINGIVSTVNTVTGAGLPTVVKPQSLAFAPIAVVGIAAAVAAAAAIIAWAAEQIVTAQNITAQIQSLPPDQRAAALAQINAANPSTLSSISSIVMWVAIGAMVWFGYKAFSEYRSGRSIAHQLSGGDEE